MDVNAIAQAAQTQQQTVPTQDGSSGSTADMFAYLLKHQFGSNVSRHALVNSQAAIDMVGQAQNAAPAPQINAAPPAPTQQNAGQTQSNQAANTGNGNNQAQAAPTNAANTNTNTNSGNATQSDDTDPRNQQNAAGTNTSSNQAAQTASQAAATAPTQTKTGEDQATEATAAIIAGAMYVVQQQTAPTASVQAIAAAASGGQAATGPQQQGTGPGNTPVSNQTAQQLAAAAEDEATPDETHLWTANFLNSGPTTPQTAQQAASLAKITGPSGANVAVQTTTGNATTASSTSTLVPDAVMAIPSFFANSDHDASTGGGTGGQQSGQQTNDNAPQAVIDPAAQALAQDLQALSAISALLQGSAQGALVAQQSTGVGGIATTAASAGATEAALPQPSQAPTQNTAAPTNFAQQLQETEEPEQTQAPKQTQLPSAVDQIKMEIEKGVASGSSTIKVQLNPDNMGRVDVKLEVQGGSVKATISADHPETLALLKSDQQGLVQALQDAGLNADSNSLSFHLRDQQQQQQFAQNGQQGRGPSGGSGETPAIAGVAASSGASAAGAANSALDISV